jgi:tetratricopeptide (TPR) repeat protein
MASLVDKSLLRQQGEHEPRFSMLETIREYAADKLDERGECETMRDAHAGYFLALAEEARPSLDQQVGEEWLDRFARERDNARVAFRRLLDCGRDEEAGRLAVALWGFWRSSRGSWIEGKRQLEEVVTRPGLSAGTRAWALARLCNYLSHGGEVDRLERTAREVVTLAQQIGDPVVEFDGVVYLWSAANRRGNQDGADALYEACLELAPRTHDLQAMTQVIRMQGFHAVQHGDLDRAAELFAEEVALRRDPEVAGDLWGALINVGWVALQRGDLDTAEAAYSERGHLPARQGLAAVALARGQYDDALRRCAEVAPAALQERTIPLLAESLLGIAQIAAVQGRPALTALLVGATDAARAELSFALERLPGEQERLDLARAALDEQAWTAEYERGRRLTLEDATQIALQFAGESGVPGSRW